MAYTSTKNLLKPFRQNSEWEVIGFFGHDDERNKGTFVKVAGSGWKNNDSNAVLGGGIEFGGAVGASYDGTVNQRYNLIGLTTPAGTGDANKVIGMLLYDVRETDENGNKLIYNPRKKAELQAVLTGEACPILSRGLVLAYATGAVAGQRAYINNSGELDTTTQNTISQVAVGKYLGSADSDSFVLLKLEL